jgi:hypothetical protein
MTIQQRSLNSLILLGLMFSATAAFGQEVFCPKSFKVLERVKKDKYDFVSKDLEKLYCKNSFEGKHFKIVNATDNTAITFDNKNQDLVKKAANVYYHLSLAHNFWVDQIGSDYVAKLPQTTVRIDITNAYSNTRHFKNEEQEKNFNNAWSTPEGETPRFVKDKMKWGKEIWFSPMKKIESRKEIKNEGKNPVHEGLLAIKEPIVDYNKSALIYQGMSFLVVPSINQSTVLEQALQRLGTIAVIYGLTEVTKYMDKMFVEKFFYIDAAMIPEIIYHEFAHIAMSDTMKTVHSVPVIEGMADYFAAAISNRTKMYSKIKGFSTNQSKDAGTKLMYHPMLEGSWNATSDYSLSLLWLGKKKFEEQNKEREEKGQAPLVNYDHMVFDAHFTLDETSDIANGLTKALIDSCEKNCASKRSGINTLNQTFEDKGLN